MDSSGWGEQCFNLKSNSYKNLEIHENNKIEMKVHFKIGNIK